MKDPAVGTSPYDPAEEASFLRQLSLLLLSSDPLSVRQAQQLISQRSLQLDLLKLQLGSSTLSNPTPPPPSFPHSPLCSLPDDVLLLVARRYLDGACIAALEGSCRRLRLLLLHHRAAVWRERFGSRDAYIQQYCLEHGLYTFRIVLDDDEVLDDRRKRRDMVWARRGVLCGKRRNVLMHCGQPTTADNGYAVSLRLCGSHLCWISNDSLAVSDVSGHSSYRLKGHASPLVCLAVNYKNLCVTGAEDGTMRLWDLVKLECVHVFYLDILDVAFHENSIVTYNNDNVVQVWDAVELRNVRSIDLKMMREVDSAMLNKEVKVAVWGDTIVCGFENTHFLVLNKSTGAYVNTLSEPQLHRREDLDSTQYPTVLALHSNILVSRGIRCYELCIWDISSGKLLYRLSESISFQRCVGGYIRPNEVITDFTMDPNGGYLMCTVENESTEVYLLVWDFRGGAGKERRFEKRALESVPREPEFDYTNFWLCYEE